MEPTSTALTAVPALAMKAEVPISIATAELLAAPLIDTLILSPSASTSIAIPNTI